MRPTPLRLLLAASLGLAAASACGEPAAGAPAAGMLQPQVDCAGEPGQSYALYLPSGYTAERAWPILYCFDPGARGRLAVERFQAAAERAGFIVAGSNNARNGPWPGIEAAAAAMIRDTHRRLRLDDRRLYAAGCSGGARAACAIAQAGGFAGVVACSGGFPDHTVPPRVSFAFFGTAGRADFNYGEMQDADAALAAQGAPHRLAVFDGGHEWLPAPLAGEALDWLELQAMRSGRRPRDDAFIAGLLRRREQDIAALRNDGEICLACAGAVADFAGLADTAALAARAAALRDSRAVRQYFKAERKARAQEERWRERLLDAVAEARHPAPRPTPGEIAGELRRRAGEDDSGFGDPAPGGGEPELGRRPRSWLPPADDRPPVNADRYAALRSTVRSIQRQAADNVAARRALEGAFVAFLEEGRTLLDTGDASAAAENLEVAAIIRPELPVTYFELARAAARRGDRAAAREQLAAALAKGFPDDARVERLRAELGP